MSCNGTLQRSVIMANKINKSKYSLSPQELDLLKEKINDPRYINKAISWIAEHLAAKISTLQ